MTDVSIADVLKFCDSSQNNLEGLTPLQERNIEIYILDSGMNLHFKESAAEVFPRKLKQCKELQTRLI